MFSSFSTAKATVYEPPEEETRLNKKSSKKNKKRKVKNKNKNNDSPKDYYLEPESEATHRMQLRNNGSHRVVKGNEKILVALVQDSKESAATSKTTKAEAEERFFGSAKSAASFFRDASDGKLQISGEVTDWINVPNLCSGGSGTFSTFSVIAKRALKQLKKEGVNVNNFTRFVFVTPNNSTYTASCFSPGLKGYGSIGKVSLATKNKRKKKQSKKKISFSFLPSSSLKTNFLEHELGHNFGALHANSYSCENGVIDGGRCSEKEYGDIYSVMGNKSMVDFSAAIKKEFGWLDKQKILHADDGYDGVVTIAKSSPIEAITIPKAKGQYYIEFHGKKPNQKQESFLRFGGATVREAYTVNGITKTRLLDARPNSALSSSTDFNDGNIVEGATVILPTIGGQNAEIRALDVSEDSVTLQIKVGV